LSINGVGYCQYRGKNSYEQLKFRKKTKNLLPHFISKFEMPNISKFEMHIKKFKLAKPLISI